MGAVDPGSLLQAGAQVVARLRIATGDAQAVIGAAITAQRTVNPKLWRLIGAAAGEDLNHPANGIAAIDHRARAAQHFYALDLVHGQVLQVAVGRGGIGHALAIDQHQALRRLGAADVNPRQAATPAAARHLHARHPAQQVGQAGGLQTVDIIAGEYAAGAAAVRACLDLAVAGDQGLREFERFFAFQGVGEYRAGGHAAQNQGNAKVFHRGSTGLEASSKSVAAAVGCVRWRSRRKPIRLGVSVIPRGQGLRWLRHRTQPAAAATSW